MPLPFPASIARLLALAVLAAASCGSARAEPSPAPRSGDVNDFRDWMVACDNLRSCSAYGVDADVYGLAYIRVTRDGAPEAALTITIGMNLDEGIKATLAFDDSTLPGLPGGTIAATSAADDGITRVVIRDAAAVAQLVASFHKAGKLIVTRIDPPGATPSDPAATEISLAGFAAAMRWIDEQQKRVGTVTAVIARGDKPASAVPPVPAARTVRAAKIAGGPPPKTIPAAVLAKAKKSCEASEPFTAAEDATRLSGNQVMYWFHCREMSGAYNYYYALVIAAPGRPPRVATFPFPPDSENPDEDAEWAVNPAFDAKTATLTTLNKARGFGDCGALSEWVWDSAAFRVLAVKAMPSCKGIPVDDWPTLFRAARK